MGRGEDERARIVIVGGGAAGTIVACSLLERDPAADVEVFEPAGELGPGLAYSTQDPRHVVNVPAAKLSAVASDPDHLLRWLAANGHEAREASFPRRSVYGRYLRDLLAERAAAARRCRLTHVQAEATKLEMRADGVDVTLRDGSTRPARAAVLALGNVAAPPAIDLPDDPRCRASPWQPGALEADGAHERRILVVGTGLTAVDAALSLADAAPHATITMVSRNGHLPFAHLPGPLRAPFPSDGFPTDLDSFQALEAAWHAHLERGLAAGFDWRDVVDGLRPRAQSIWRALGVDGQSEFLRTRRRDWEARRNRAAPLVGAQLVHLLGQGRLQVLAGGVGDIDPAAGGVSARVAGSTIRFDRVICCTGPTADVRRTTNPLLQQLLADGIAVADAHHLAVRTATDGELVDSGGRAQAHLFTLGWMRRGELWETLAIPEIREQARVIADRLVALVGLER